MIIKIDSKTLKTIVTQLLEYTNEVIDNIDNKQTIFKIFTSISKKMEILELKKELEKIIQVTLCVDEVYFHEDDFFFDSIILALTYFKNNS